MSNKKLGHIMALILLFLFISVYVHADVKVSSEGTYSDTDLTLNIYADTTGTANGDAEPILSYGVKVTYDTADITSPVVTKNNTDWFFGALGGTIYPTPNAEPVVTENSGVGEVVFVGGKLDQDDPTAGVDTTGMPDTRVLLASIVFQRSSTNIPAITIDTGKGGTYTNFVTTDGDVLDGTARLEFLAASITPECKLAGDINRDGVVNYIDLTKLQADWLKEGTDIVDPNTDINNDGVVNYIDLTTLQANWLQSCN